jgi:hypothetical protein
MTAEFFGHVPRVALLASVVLLSTATLTLAATSTGVPTTPVEAPAAAERPTLTVPDVRRQAYVFAKSALEEAGFAWRVEGAVAGYAANVVAEQNPAAGAEVFGDGAPTVVLRLSKNPAYEQEGSPENLSPYPGTTARLVRAKPVAVAQAKPKMKPVTKAPSKSKPTAGRVAKKSAAPLPRRVPAFAVKGAPPEPLSEIPLSARANRLAAWLESHPTRTAANVNHWLYQHNWIVTGAGFGWSQGAKALRTLVAVDERAQELWGVGARSERLARRTLLNVERAAK